MTICEICGNEYDPSAELDLGCEIETFDKFETAFYSIAPICAHCNHPILEQGIEAAGVFFCCIHCAHNYQTADSKDRPHPYLLDEFSPVLDEAIW